MSRKILLELNILLMFVLFACGCNRNHVESTASNTTSWQEGYSTYSNESEDKNLDYAEEIKKLTNKEIHDILIDDFENNGEEDAFILVKDKKEGAFELWFLTPDSNEKIVDSFIAENDTSIEMLEEDKKYCLLNVAQTRQNDEMWAAIYGVSGRKAEKLFSKKKINFFIENGELYAYNGSYSVLEPEFDEWMSLSEQKYHFRWDRKQKTVVEYEAQIISEEQFSNLSKSDKLKENINRAIQKKYADNIKDIEYAYLIREDDSADINFIVTLKDGSRHKHHVTVSEKNNILETDVHLLDGNKEESFMKTLN